MTHCPFTIQLPLYTGPAGRLRNHVGRCSECHVAALLVASYSGEQGRTVKCPDVVTFTAYEQDLLDPDELAAIHEHLDDCGFCMSLLLEGRRAEANDDEVLRALLQGEAYILAKEIATWLATEKYPLERERVSESFDVAYDAAQKNVHSSARDKGASPAMALGFSGSPERALFQKIIDVSLIVGQIHQDARGDVQAIPQMFEQSVAMLPEGFASPSLLDAVVLRLKPASG